MMFQLLNANQNSEKRYSIKAFLAILFTALLAGGLLAALIINDVSSQTDMLVVFAVLIIIVAMIPISLLFSRNTTSSETTEKQKRVLAGMDMYSLIDRMVQELDEDEIAYLQNQLDQRSGAQKQDLQASLGDLLNQRAEKRLTD
ncbi:MAG: hypothetical protein H7X77_07230 [Anaerolineae bacterium]|nr:hypothetical protein [Anaerolineae bacterium]